MYIYNNGSTVPVPMFKTDASLFYFDVNLIQIVNIINKLIPNKSHGDD